MNSKFYKYCVVPKCGNTTTKTPDKLFIYVPNKEDVRKKWLKLAKRDPEYLSKDSRMYFCEDHFDLPNDMENYMEYHIMGSVLQIRLRPGCTPSRFECQKKKIKSISIGREASSARKKRKPTPVEDFMSAMECQVCAFPLALDTSRLERLIANMYSKSKFPFIRSSVKT